MIFIPLASLKQSRSLIWPAKRLYPPISSIHISYPSLQFCAFSLHQQPSPVRYMTTSNDENVKFRKLESTKTYSSNDSPNEPFSENQTFIQQENGKMNQFRKYRIESGKLVQDSSERGYSYYCPSKPWGYMMEYLLPKNYESTVTPNYLTFVKWSIVSSVFATACGVLSMQSLLFAVGLGNEAIPMAAALNWILKDGLGQLGGILCASFINNRFDAEPRKWRFFAGLILDISMVLEVITVLFPALFLPLASLANVGKNIGWISASASRASIHRSFMRTENLADITAKAGSQSIFASVMGTGLGLSVGPALLMLHNDIFCAYNILGKSADCISDNIFLGGIEFVLVAFFSMSFVHLVSLTKSLRQVHAKGLTLERLILSAYHSMSLNVDTSQQTDIEKNGFSKYDARESKNYSSCYTSRHLNVDQSQGGEDMNNISQDLHNILDYVGLEIRSMRAPNEVANIEPIVHLSNTIFTKKTSVNVSKLTLNKPIKNDAIPIETLIAEPLISNREPLNRRKVHLRMEISPEISLLNGIHDYFQKHIKSGPNKGAYIYCSPDCPSNNTSAAISILISANANNSDILKSSFAALILCKLLESDFEHYMKKIELWTYIAEALANYYFNQFVLELQKTGWDTENIFLETNRRRVLLNS